MTYSVGSVVWTMSLAPSFAHISNFYVTFLFCHQKHLYSGLGGPVNSLQVRLVHELMLECEGAV